MQKKETIMHILCIDDDKTFLTIYKKVLNNIKQPDDEIYLSSNCNDAIAIVNEKPINLVITDLVMPTKNGIDVIKKVKELNSIIEVIIVTGQGSIDSAVEAMRLGARDYITKPLNNSMLIEKINNIREFIYRANETEDYRFAKETIEKSAIKTIAEMEIKLDIYISLVDNIKKLLTSKESNEMKIQNIFDYISSTEKEI